MYSSIKRPTYEESIAKLREQQQRAREKAKIRQSMPKELRPKLKLKPDRIVTLKAKLWKKFSEYIRKKYADRNGMVLTCDGVRKHWKQTHCGHLYNNTERNSSLGGNALWYDERNFAPQSSNGNYWNANDSAKKYMMWAIEKYGVEAVQEMRILKGTARKFTEEELEAKYSYYKAEFDKL